jgi:hypothetical protein
MMGAFALLSFPFGVLIGYLWRDRISHARRARQVTKLQSRPEPEGAAIVHSIVSRRSGN